MSPSERWQRVQQLAENPEALASETDASLQAEAQKLRHALIAEPHASRDRVSRAASAAAPPNIGPSRIGPYRIAQRLGRGGTGTVYAAEVERAGVLQTVAIKVLDSYLDPEAITRFQREQQMLMRLDHPAILHVLDAGVTPEQRPYLVMEKVDGQPLDSYCQERQISLQERLRLMIEVCEAVQAAHRALIVHLDLKPSNILVTTAGQVKLLDFGTAKLLDPAGALTTTRQLTPMYASPEQLRGEPVTTACDIYSLGLILFELLTGAWPFASRSSIVAVSERAAGTTETRKLAAAATGDTARDCGLTLDRLRAALRGDLEAIVAKAIAPEASRRYDSPAALAADLQAHRQQRPVRAQRQTTAYRVKKYVARNTGSVALTAMLAFGLLAAAGYAWWQQQQKIEAGRKAQATAHFLGWLFSSSTPMYGGKNGATVLDLVDKAEARLQAGDMEPALSASLRAAMGNLALSGGRAEQGQRLLRQSLAKARESGDPNAILDSLAGNMTAELTAGRCAPAIQIGKEGDALLATRRSDLRPTLRISFLVSRAQVKMTCEQDRQAVLGFCQSIERDLPLVSDDQPDLWIPPRLWKALVHNGLANNYLALGRQTEARRAVEAGLAYTTREREANAAQVALYRSLAAIEYASGSAAKAAGALGKAVAAMQGGYVSTFEYLRTKVMWAARRAEAGDSAGAVTLIDDALQQTAAKADEIGPTRWMILVDSAFANLRAGRCAPVSALVREADQVSAGQMPPQWRGNRLAAEGLCAVAMGRPEGRTLVKQALETLNPFMGPQAPLRKRLESAAASP